MTDLNEKLAQEAAELINGGEWRDGKWYSDGQRDAWRRALKPAADRIEKLEAALRWIAKYKIDISEEPPEEIGEETHKMWICLILCVASAEKALEGKENE